jgi:hypothetical protein
MHYFGKNVVDFFLQATQFLCQTFFFLSLTINEDEDISYIYVAMAVHFEVRLTCQGHTPRIIVLNKSRNYTKKNI